MAISLTIDGAQVALKKGSSIEYVLENRIFTDASNGQSSKKENTDYQASHLDYQRTALFFQLNNNFSSSRKSQ